MALTRRTFIKSALALGAFTIVPRRVLGGTGYTPPSDELTKAYTQPSTAITGIAAYDLEAPSRNARAIL